MIQSGGFLGRLLGPLLKTGLLLIKNVIKPLAKSVSIPLGLTAVASVEDAGIHKKILGSGHNHPSHNNTKLIISNDEIQDIIKMIKSLEDSGLLLKGFTKTVQNEVKEQKGGCLSALLGTLGASLLGDLLIGDIKGKGVLTAGEGILRASYGSHPLTNFEIQQYYQDEPRFNGVYSIDNLPERSSTEIKDGAYIINLDEYSDTGNHWVALYIQNNNVTYFDSFGVEHIPKEIKEFVKNKNIITNIFRI